MAAVLARPLDLLPELPEKLIDDEQSPYTLIVLVTGEYLDDHANQERTRIAFQSDEEPELEQTLVSRRALNQGIASALRPLLTDDLKSTNEEKRVQIEKFVEQAPEYRALTHPRYREIIEQRIQPGLSDEKLDEALLHGIRFFGYLIADLTPSLKREMRMNYHESIDGEGYFKTLTGGNGYVEIISYDKLLKDAARRNRVLFEKLGLHKN